MNDKQKEILLELDEVLGWEESIGRNIELSSLYNKAQKMGISYRTIEKLCIRSNEGVARLRKMARERENLTGE